MKKAVLILMIALAFGALCAQAESFPEITAPEEAVPGTACACDDAIRLSGAEDVAIELPGSYLIEGETDGTLTVDAADGKVKLCLNGAYIRGGVRILNAGKNVTVYTCPGSVNVICDEEAGADGEAPKAALESKEDLKFKGEGVLYVISDSVRGIHSSDDIEILAGEIYVKSAGDGIRGKDSVTISGGSVTVESGGDGIVSNEEEKDDKGFIEIAGGIVYVRSGGGHTENTTVHSEGPGGFGGPGGFPGGSFGGGPGGMRGGDIPGGSETAEDDAPSVKAIKAARRVSVSGGETYIDANDDALHSNGDVYISGGSIVIYSGDDAVHADSVLAISGGDIEICECYEGLEGTVVNISDGTIRLKASDDGINAAGDDDTVTQAASAGGAYGGRFGFMGGNGLGEINISGGYTVIDADGDGIDSNNLVTMSGGTLIVYGPVSSMNGALDYETSFGYTGGMILAVGAAGMAESVTSCENGAVLAFRLSMAADTLLTVEDKAGEEVIAFCAPKSYSCVVFVSESLTAGEEYSVCAGGSREGDIRDGIYLSGKTEGAELLGSLSAY